ncbi:MAG TPA: hypothetical protein PKY59_22965, partial [Pyrinomonadaceae bacterium]|nr:hypothetical protein [Pyrinomonadaceae bacterium]
MKAKKYRLETVLDIRRRAKDEAAKIVALRFQQLEKAEAELAQRRLNLQNCYEKQNQAQANMAEDLSKGIQANAIIAHQNYLNDLRKLEIDLQKRVDEQIQTVAAAEREVEKARENLIESAKELKAIEVHKENWKVTERTA